MKPEEFKKDKLDKDKLGQKHEERGKTGIGGTTPQQDQKYKK